MDMKKYSKYGDKLEGKKAFAFLRDATSRKVYAITDDDAVNGRKVEVLKKNKKFDGIKYVMQSKTKCPYKKDKKGKPLMFKWTSKI